MKDKNRIITFIGIIAILFIWLLLYAKPGKNESIAINTDLTPKGAQELPNSHTTGLSNTLTTTETFYDFGTISMKDGNVSRVFQVSNPTSSDIKVSSLTTSCMCTNAYILKQDGNKKGPYGMPGHGGFVPKANETIPAGGTMDLEVVYNPNAHGPAGVGLIKRSVFLEDDNDNIIEFKIRVNVTP